jgi:hypothetical protein
MITSAVGAALAVRLTVPLDPLRLTLDLSSAFSYSMPFTEETFISMVQG